jgi:hypothetical protein
MRSIGRVGESDASTIVRMDSARPQTPPPVRRYAASTLPIKGREARLLILVR